MCLAKLHVKQVAWCSIYSDSSQWLIKVSLSFCYLDKSRDILDGESRPKGMICHNNLIHVTVNVCTICTCSHGHMNRDNVM